jgi:hypothetical protein
MCEESRSPWRRLFRGTRLRDVPLHARRSAGPPKWSARGLSGQSLLGAGPIVERVERTGGEAGWAPLTLGNGLRLDPVLTKGGEVDHQVGGVEDVLAND